MKIIGIGIILISFLIHSIPSSAAGQRDVFGIWGTVKLQGDFKYLSPELSKFKWTAMNQTRTRDDSSRGSRFFQDLLFGQIGYQLNGNVSVWLGYTHTWTSPLNKSSFQESRPYQDFVWSQKVKALKLVGRFRMEQRIREITGNVGYRARQLLKVSHPVPLVKHLSIYIGDEILFYMNENKFGKKGFSENRVFSGLSYQATENINVGLGYMGQYVDTISGKNIFTHNIEVNFGYKI